MIEVIELIEIILALMIFKTVYELKEEFAKLKQNDVYRYLQKRLSITVDKMWLLIKKMDYELYIIIFLAFISFVANFLQFII